jgi:hypothetical protein
MTFMCGLKDRGQSKINRQAGRRPFIPGSSAFFCPGDIWQAGQIMSDLPGIADDGAGRRSVLMRKKQASAARAQMQKTGPRRRRATCKH